MNISALFYYAESDTFLRYYPCRILIRRNHRRRFFCVPLAMMGCPWVYLVKRPDGHDGVPLGIRWYTGDLQWIIDTDSTLNWSTALMKAVIYAADMTQCSINMAAKYYIYLHSKTSEWGICKRCGGTRCTKFFGSLSPERLKYPVFCRVFCVFFNSFFASCMENLIRHASEIARMQALLKKYHIPVTS